jgi:hypothetical protein
MPAVTPDIDQRSPDESVNTPTDSAPTGPVTSEQVRQLADLTDRIQSRGDRGRPAPSHEINDVPPTLNVIPTIYPTSASLEESVEGFWEIGPQFDDVEASVTYPETPLEILELLGPSPFPRGRFPLIGFLATTYDKVSRYAVERGGHADQGGE